MIEFQNVTFTYQSTERESGVYHLNMTIPDGQVVLLCGESGCGKTTITRLINGLTPEYYEGKLDGTLNTSHESLGTKQRLKRSYMVMQDVNHQLFTESVSDEILLGMPGEDAQEDKKKSDEILDSLNLLEYKELHPMSLSGGQKQRVAIGSAVASDKEFLVFDEPTSGLDYHHMLEVADNLRRLSEMGKTLFIITHDPELIAKCCNYFIFIEHGKIAWSGGWTSENKRRITDFFSFAI